MVSTHSVSVVTCQQTSTGGTIVGLLIFAGFIGAIVILAIANSRARSRLAVANGELNYLRYENVRLQSWQTGPAAMPANAIAASPYPVQSPTSPQWHADPFGRHELRLWDGHGWSGEVSDRGVLSKDPPE
jgi:hypothetical protein